MVPQQTHAVFYAAGAIGYQGEIVFAHLFLRQTKTTMIRGCGLQHAGLQPAPKTLLVRLGPKWRAHDMSRRGVPVGMPVNGIVDKQVARQDFAEHPLPLVSRPLDGLQGILARSMHQIQGDAHYLGDSYRPVRGLAFHFRRPGQGVALGPGDALFNKLALQVEDQLAVFSVDGADGA